MRTTASNPSSFMLIQGEKLVSEHVGKSVLQDVRYRSRWLLISSPAEPLAVNLSSTDRLLLWGTVHAVVLDDGSYLPIPTRNEASAVIQKRLGGRDARGLSDGLEGDFVGCLFRGERIATLFADAFHRRDVFYGRFSEGMIVSDNLEPLRQIASGAYDQAALSNMLCVFGGYAPKKHTMYRNVRRLGIGERLILTPGDVRIAREPFRPAVVQEYGSRHLDDYARAFTEATAIRASANRTWLYLSGGWDSSALLAILVRDLGADRVRTVTGRIALSPISRDTNVYEADRARRVAEWYGVEHHEVPWDLTTDSAVEMWEQTRPLFRANHIYARNACDYSFMTDYLRHRMAPGDVIFSGEVSDGAHNLGFASNRTIQDHPDLSFRAYADKMACYLFGPTFLKSLLSGDYARDAVYQALRSRLAGHVFDAADALRSGAQRAEAFLSACFLRGHRIPFYSLQNHAFLTPAGAEAYQTEMRDTYLSEALEDLLPENVYGWALHLYNSFHWQGSTLKSIRVTADRHGLSLAFPYWDRRLQQFLSAMPEDWGRGLELRPIKYPLRSMLEKKAAYPHDLQVNTLNFRNDVDPQFSFDAEWLYRSAPASLFRECMRRCPFEAILDAGWFNLDYLRRIATEYAAGRETSGEERTDLARLVQLCWVGWY